jgi:hypothetical protein
VAAFFGYFALRCISLLMLISACAKCLSRGIGKVHVIAALAGERLNMSYATFTYRPYHWTLTTQEVTRTLNIAASL